MEIDFNTDADHINIPLNKYRLTGFLLITITIGPGGLCLMRYSSTSVSTYHYSYRDLSKPEIAVMRLI